MDLIKIHLSEVTQLEPLLMANLEKIEAGMKPLEHQLNIGTTGRPDVMAVDKNGTLVLLELKSVTADTSAINQCIKYYEWFVQNLALIARPFPAVRPNEGIRLFVVAPDFEEDAVRIASYINLDISLVKYIGLQDKETKKIGITFEKLDLESIEGPEVGFRSIEDIILYFADESLEGEFRKVLEELENKGIKHRPYKGGKHYWIECSFDDEEIMYLQPRQKYFNCQIYDKKKDDWPRPIRCDSYDEWIKEFKVYVEECVKNDIDKKELGLNSK